MTTYRRILMLLCGGIALTAPVHGQDAARVPPVRSYVDETTGLSLDAAIARAYEREPSLRAVRAEVEAARGRREQAGLRPNPSMTVEHRAEPAGTDALTNVEVSLPLDLFRRRGRVQTADREIEATDLMLSDRERLLAADVRMQYGIAAGWAREVAVADDIVSTAKRQLATVRARVEAGGTPPLEANLLEVDVRRLETQRLVAAGRADAALVQLKVLLGMTPDEPLLLRETLETLVTSRTAAGPHESPLATAARPDVREAEVRVLLAEARIDQARREGRVDVTLFGAYMRMDAGFPQQGVGPTGVLERVRGRFDYVTAGATIMLPVFNRNQGQVTATRAEHAGAQARHAAAQLAARAEVAAAEVRETSAQQAIGLYTGGLRALARQNLDVVRQTFDLGRGTVFDVLTEQRRYLEIEQAYTTVLREAWDARVELQRARGEPR